MAKLKDSAVGQSDLIEFVDTTSDFAFEMQTLKLLTDCNWKCTHGWTYFDPATNKPREFDIRARYGMVEFRLMLAVECKNLRENFPLLVSCVPRLRAESFHDVVVKGGDDFWGDRTPESRRKQSIRVITSGIFPPGPRGIVGKSCNQVGRLAHDGSLTFSDTEVFDKWSQAIASCRDLIVEFQQLERSGKTIRAAILPVVVVPNGRLWKVVYDDSGERVGDPEETDSVDHFVGYTFSGIRTSSQEFTISHIRFMTVAGLRNFVTGVAELIQNRPYDFQELYFENM